MSFLAELKRRNVIRMALYDIVSAWLPGPVCWFGYVGEASLVRAAPHVYARV
jgi:hypothetical protein